MVDVTRWLNEIGLPQYVELFRAHNIDRDVLSSLTVEDLKELGIASLGHRKKLLAAIASLTDAPAAGQAGRSAPEAESRRPSPLPPPIDAERRQLTVMFCDLVGSTPLAASLDPEDLRDLVRAYHACCADIVGKFDGSVAQYLGDGVMVRFGYPRAHEDDAERAVRCGLDMIKAVGELSAPKGITLEVRIGLATGIVVVGDQLGSGPTQERAAVGETPNLAARVQAVAAPNSLVVSESTWRLAGSAFDYDDLGPRELKGIPGAVRLWRVVGESSARGRFDARSVKGLTPLVGRAEEVALLRQRWEYAKGGDGQLVLLSAPAGLGKSRVIQAFRESLADAPPPCLQFFGSPFHTNSAFHPFIRQLEWAAGITRSDPPAGKIGKLEAILEDATESTPDAVPLMASLLSIPFGERCPPLQINEHVQKQRTMEVLEEQLALSARGGPVLVLFEDAHWIDATSLEVMNGIIRRVVDLPVMVIVNYRPEFTPPWSDLGHSTMLRLNHLGRRQAVDLIRSAAHGKALPEAIVAQIVEKSQGVPLFVEEITRSVLESGDLEEHEGRYVLRQSIREFAIPPTLQESLIARLDRLGSAKDVALTASIIGREFAYEVIEAISPVPPAILQVALEQLVQSDLLEQRGVPPQSRYIFKHALIQDAAYQSVLRAKRRGLHQRIAGVLADRFPELAETEPELLAYHHTEANAIEGALAYWRRAVERAASRLSYIEALGHIEKAKTLIEALPEGQARDEWELTFLVIEGPSRMALDGWDSPPAKVLYDKARAAAERLGRPAEVFRSVWGLWMGAHSSGQHARAHALYREILGLSKEGHDPEYVVQAHHAGGSQMVAEGRPRLALSHIDQLLASYRMDLHGNLALVYGAHDPGCCSLGMRALSLLMLGYLEQAQAASARALDLSERLGHKPSIAHTNLFRAELCIILDRPEEAEAHLETCLSLSKKYSLAAYLNAADLKEGWVRVVRGDIDAGLRQTDEALELLKSVPSRRFHLPIRIAIVGRTKAAANDVEGALALFDAALEAAATTGERWYEAELFRFKAEMLLAKNHPDVRAVEECLQTALSIAQGQEARFWEMRAATALAKLWDGQGRRTEAHAVLAPVLGWFTEGLGTRDLKEARALLDGLSR
jgi:predicted ATPase/class 3 adenylate cyclase